MSTIDLKVNGMTCGSCVSHVKKALGGLAGVSSVNVDLASGHVNVSGERLPSTDVLLNELNAAGYPGAVETSPDTQDSCSASRPESRPRSGGCFCG